MSLLKTVTMLSCAVVLGAALLPSARADEWNKKTTITFNEPVEIPGRVLQPGTYVFKLMDSLADRNIVQIFSKNQQHLYATILAIPDYRLKPTGKPVVTFEERAAGSPEAVRAWFYPGDVYGNEFVYPKVRAVQLAKETHQNVLSMPNELASNITKPVKSSTEPSVMAMKKSHVKAEKPNGQETEMAEVVQSRPTPKMNPAKETAMAKHHAARRRMPETASQWALLGLLGFFSLGTGLGLHFVLRQAE